MTLRQGTSGSGLWLWLGRGDFVDLFSAVGVSVIMQRQFCAPDSVHRQWLDIPAMRAETSTHSANCADDRRDSPGAAPGLVLDMPVIVQRRCAVRGVKVVDWSFCAENHRDTPVAVH